MEGSLTLAERRAFVALKSLGGALSVIGSSLIIHIALRHRKAVHSQRPTYHRFLLAMSIYDLVQAVWQAVGSLPVPRWTGGLGCYGTTATCSALGFFVTLALGGWIYNAGLSIYYVLVIRHGITETAIAKRFEPTIHVLAFVIPMILGTSGLFLTVFNPIIPGPEVGCFAWPYPVECFYDTSTCERGQYYGEWGWAFYAMQCLCVAIVMVMSAVLYATIRRQYNASSRYAAGESMQMRERSRAVAVQAFLFALACFYANIWNILIVVTYNHGPDALFKFVLLNGLFGYPGQGFFNFLIYIGPRYRRTRLRMPEAGRLGALYQVIFISNEEENRRGSFSSKTPIRRRSSLSRTAMAEISRELRAITLNAPLPPVQEGKSSVNSSTMRSELVPDFGPVSSTQEGMASSNESTSTHRPASPGHPGSTNEQDDDDFCPNKPRSIRHDEIIDDAADTN